MALFVSGAESAARKLLVGLRWGMLVLIMAGCTQPAFAWRSSLYPLDWSPPAVGDSFETNKLIQDFSYAGYRAGEAPLPVIAGPVFNVTQAPYLADSTGTNDATLAIQAALNAAGSAAGGVVFMPAGLYRVSLQSGANYALRINSPRVVLRGAGTNQTFLLNTSTNMRSRSVILVEGPGSAGFFSSGAGSTAIRTDLTGPALTIPVASTSGLSVGQFVVVRADATDAWISEHNEPLWLGYGTSLRGTAYLRRVMAVDMVNQQITIDSPTRYYLKQRDAARVVRLTGSPITECGLEQFSIGNVQINGNGWAEEDYNYSTNASYFAHDSFLVRMVRTRDCWVRQVNSFRATENSSTCHLLSNGILLSESTRVTLLDVHFQRPQFGGGGGNGYMFRLANAGDCLVQWCRSTFSRHGMVLSSMSSSGNVFHRCVDKDTGKQTGNTGSQNTSGSNCDHHMHLSHSQLVDACTGENSAWEARYRPYGSTPLHNLTAAHTVYWNMQGLGSGGAIVRTEQSRYGYAIGTRGTRTTVDRPTFGGTKCNPADHVEGAGLGDSLEPFSLYEDQLLRRLKLPGVTLPALVAVPFPSNSVALSASVFSGGEPASPGAYTLQWSAITSPVAVLFSDPATAQTLATFSTRGNHLLQVLVTSGQHQVTGQVMVVLAPAVFNSRESFLATADAYVRDGTYATNNYGLDNTIQVKKSTSGFNRRSFLRFDLADVKLTNFHQAHLELQTTASPAQASVPTLELWQVPDNQWAEDTITWANQPGLGSLARSWLMSTSGVERAEITALVRQVLKQPLSLGLQVGSQPGAEVFSFYARQSSAGPPPTLVLETTHAPITYASWIGSYGAVPAGERAPDSDPDRDGFRNGMEYYLGTDPAKPNDPGSFRVTKVNGGVAIQFSLNRNLTSNANWFFEQTEDLANPDWKLAPAVSYRSTGETLSTVMMEAFLPEPPLAKAAFYRVRLQL